MQIGDDVKGSFKEQSDVGKVSPSFSQQFYVSPNNVGNCFVVVKPKEVSYQYGV